MQIDERTNVTVSGDELPIEYVKIHYADDKSTVVDNDVRYVEIVSEDATDK